MSEVAGDLEALYRHIEANPKDWDAYLVLADWYEEHGDMGRAEAVRWVAREQIRCHPEYKGLYRKSYYDKSAHYNDPQSNVPDEVFEHLIGERDIARKDRDRFYTSNTNALKDLQEAWMKAYWVDLNSVTH